MSYTTPIISEAMTHTKDPPLPTKDSGRSQSERSTRSARNGITDGPAAKKPAPETFKTHSLTPTRKALKALNSRWDGLNKAIGRSHTPPTDEFEPEERAKTPTQSQSRQLASLHSPSMEIDYGPPIDVGNFPTCVTAHDNAFPHPTTPFHEIPLL